MKGTRVYVNIGDGRTIKDTGTIVEVDFDNRFPYLVRFDSWRGGHGKGNREWWVRDTQAKMVEPEEELNSLLLAEMTKRLPKKIRSLDYDLYWHEDEIKVGCQKVTAKDAVTLARAILEAYGE